MSIISSVITRGETYQELDRLLSNNKPETLAKDIEAYILSQEGYEEIKNNAKYADNFYYVLSTFLLKKHNSLYGKEFTPTFSVEFYTRMEELIREYGLRHSN